jgi:uncharacterized protein YdhG (YjbR/CyaY superfamily)
MTPPLPASTAAYIAGFPPPIQDRLRAVRALILDVVPQAEERISYGILGYFLDGRALIYEAGFKDHLSVYPVGQDMPGIGDEILPFFSGKGTMRLPLEGDLPEDLLRRVVELKVRELRARQAARPARKGRAKPPAERPS